MSARPFVLGLTGNIAVGKSTVAEMLVARGAHLIDADKVYHDLVTPGSPLLAALTARFGPTIVTAGGELDRRALGGIVFAEPTLLSDLEAITRPAIVAAIHERIAAIPEGVVVLDVYKLFESKLSNACDQIWIVVADRDQQIARLMQRRGLTVADAERRVDVQPPIGPKLPLADRIIDTSGTLEWTQEQVLAAWADVKRISSPSSLEQNEPRAHGTRDAESPEGLNS